MGLHLGAQIKVGDTLDPHKAAVGIHGADLHIGIGLDLLVAFLVGAHAEVQFVFKDHGKAEGADTGLIAIAAGKEKAVALFEIIVDLLDLAHVEFLLR